LTRQKYSPESAVSTGVIWRLKLLEDRYIRSGDLKITVPSLLYDTSFDSMWCIDEPRSRSRALEVEPYPSTSLALHPLQYHSRLRTLKVSSAVLISGQEMEALEPEVLKNVWTGMASLEVAEKKRK
jgi:hypothetical protein